jgi:protein-disulfide isomerase
MTIEEKSKNNNINTQMIVIVALLVVIAIMGFFLGKNTVNSPSTNTTNTWANTNVPVTGDYEELSIVVIDDKRCTDCPTDAILDQLKQLPSVAWVEIERKDFSDAGVADYLNANEIKALPLIAFSTNNFDVSVDPVQMDESGQPTPKVNSFLKPLPGWEFILEIGSVFNPFAERSDRGFLLLDKAELKKIKDDSYIKWSVDSKITWIEYSDLECPYCAKLHNAGTVEDLFEKYGEDLNKVFNHFPLGFHDNAQPGAEILECLAEQKWTDAFYALIKKAYTDEKSDKDYLIAEAVTLWANKTDLEKCLSDAKYAEKVKNQMAKGTELFNVTGTPGNVLVNNETGEYEVISWAYPTTSFEEIIDKLLK